VNADGSNLHALTQSGPATGNYHPAWSPDGSTIAYWHGSIDSPIDSPDGAPIDAEIYTIPAGGGRPMRLTHDDAASIEPAWSPDDKLIVYRTAPPDDLIVMRTAATHTRDSGLDEPVGAGVVARRLADRVPQLPSQFPAR
jgi:Tol biopolymer transport system component